MELGPGPGPQAWWNSPGLAQGWGGGCLGSLESGFLAREWFATLANAGESLPSPIESWAVLGSSSPQPQVTLHQAAGGSLAAVLTTATNMGFNNNLEIGRLGARARGGGGASACRPASPRPAALARPCQSRFTRWLRTWPGPGLGVRPPPPAPNWLICRCVNKGAAPPPV